MEIKSMTRGAAPRRVQIRNMLKYSPRREEMLKAALLILRSMNFIGRQMIKKYQEFEESIINREYERADEIKNEFILLSEKIKREDKIIQEFLIKHKGLILNEKKAILRNTFSKKSLHIRGISQNERG